GDCGVFDVSHMGRFEFEGPKVPAALQRLLSNDLDKVDVGGAQYTLLTNERGGIIDDLIVYRVEGGGFFLIVNAGNREADFDWILEHAGAGTDLRDKTEEFALLAVQGPGSLERLPPGRGGGVSRGAGTGGPGPAFATRPRSSRCSPYRGRARWSGSASTRPQRSRGRWARSTGSR